MPAAAVTPARSRRGSSSSPTARSGWIERRRRPHGLRPVAGHVGGRPGRRTSHPRRLPEVPPMPLGQPGATATTRRTAAAPGRVPERKMGPTHRPAMGSTGCRSDGPSTPPGWMPSSGDGTGAGTEDEPELGIVPSYPATTRQRWMTSRSRRTAGAVAVGRAAPRPGSGRRRRLAARPHRRSRQPGVARRGRPGRLLDLELETARRTDGIPPTRPPVTARSILTRR